MSADSECCSRMKRLHHGFISSLLFAICASQWQPMRHSVGSIAFFLAPVLATSVGQWQSEGGGITSALEIWHLKVNSYKNLPSFIARCYLPPNTYMYVLLYAPCSKIMRSFTQSVCLLHLLSAKFLCMELQKYSEREK